jgi:hypothetical protein
MTNTITPADQRAINRAGAHAAAEAVLRPEQRLRFGVTDLDMARVMRALELGTTFTYAGGGDWLAPLGYSIRGARLSRTIAEMLRTGLVRKVRNPLGGSWLSPAPVHLRSPEDRNVSACLFPGEGLGAIRARLSDDLLDVDCLECERVVSTGVRRGER